MRIDEVTLGQIGSGIKGAVAGFQQNQRQRQVQQNTQAVSKAAQQQWNNKLVQLQQAGVPETQWENHLADFVERTMLRSYKIADLEDAAGVENAMKDVINAGIDQKKLSPAMNTLVQQALVARLDPAKSSYQSPAAQKTVGPGAKQPPATQQLNPTQAASAVSQIMRGANVNPSAVAQALQQVTGGPVAIPRTNSTIANALLKALGFDVK